MVKQDTKATLCGIGAILLWSSLALLTTNASSIPPFQMAAMTFTIGGSFGLIITTLRGKLSTLKQPLSVWAVGVGGLFGYHALYFAALQLAPPAEANVLNYLWPLWLVLLSSWLFPIEKIGYNQIKGTLLGFAGVCFLITSHKIIDLNSSVILGFILAAVSSMVWAVYSVLSRKLGNIPTDTVTGFCLATAVLSFIAHLLFEATVMPSSSSTWLSIALAGLGPVGAAFFLWDIGVKRGNIALLGTLSYVTPILSTGLLILAGRSPITADLLIACLLIVGGAAIASKKTCIT